MKMTMYVDEGLLARVMAMTGVTSKTKAIDLALREMDRRAAVLKLCSEGLGIGPDELKDAVEPSYRIEETRRMETPVYYGRKPRSR